LEIDRCYNIDCQEGIKLIGDGSVDLILTDPPYQVGYDNKAASLSEIGKACLKQLRRDAPYIEAKFDYELLAQEFYRVLKDNSHCYIFCSAKQICRWWRALGKAGFKRKQLLIWKSSPKFDLTRGHYFLSTHENIIFAHKGWKKLNRWAIEPSKFHSVLEYDKNVSNKWHPCEKPFLLLYDLLKLSTKPKDVVLDAFAGSGAHLIAAKRLGRHFIGFELAVPYHEVIQKRLGWENEQVGLGKFV